MKRGFTMRAILVGALLILPTLTSAQERIRDAGVLRFYQGGREIARESFRRTDTTFMSEIRIPVLDLRLAYRTDYTPDGWMRRLEATAYSLSADSLVRNYTAVADGDSLRLTQTDASGSERNWSAAGRAEAGLGAQTIAAFVDLVARSNRRDRSFTVWSPERNALTDISITFSNDSARIQTGPLLVIAVLDAAGRARSISVPAQGVTAERAGTETLPPLEGIERPEPNYDAEPNDPYTTVAVQVSVTPRDGEAFELAGTLAIPRGGEPPYAAAVTITGSGGQDRDESLWPLVQGYRPFRQIAERLALEGIATLRVDDRGVGASGGDAARATTADLADDVRAEVEWLRARPEIDAARVVLIGHSEGGVIGPMLAATDRDIAAIVVMAGTAKPGVDVLRDQILWPLGKAEGLTPDEKAALRDAQLEQLRNDSLGGSAWLRWFRTYDPLPTAREVEQPVLILHGELDRQVTVGQADTLAQAMREGGNEDVEVHKFPRLNHLFLVALEDGSPSEYAALPDTEVPQEVLDILAGWLVRRLKPGS